jgi:hypothetical protein
VFFYRFCTDLIAELFTPPLTAVLMEKNLWIPLLGAILFQGISTIMILIVPETLSIATRKQANDYTDSSQVGADTSGKDEEQTWFIKWKYWMRETSDSFSFITRDATVGALVFTFLISKVGRQSTNILLQYVSKRYGWTLAEVSIQYSFVLTQTSNKPCDRLDCLHLCVPL